MVSKKAIGLLMAVMIFAVLACGTAYAEEYKYKVKRGDYLSKIARNFGVSWKSMARLNKLKNPNLIHPGQILSIPRNFYWENVNADPYKGTAEEALALLGYDEAARLALAEKISKGEYEKYSIKKGEIIAVMTFGQKKVYRNVISSFKKRQTVEARLYEAEVDGRVYRLLYPLVCGNWSRLEEKTIPPEITAEPAKVTTEIEIPPQPEVMLPAEEPEVIEKETFPALAIEEARPEISVPIAEVKKELRMRDKFDAYIGFGNYREAHQDQDAKGYYAWGKVRYRPIWFYLGNNFDLGVGAFAFGALGGGYDRDFKYNWKEYELGVTQKLVGTHFDIDLDQGLGKLWNQGGVEKYRSRQKDQTLLLSGHLNYYARRDAGEKWFPKTELNFETRLTYNTHHRHSWDKEALKPQPADNRRWEAMLTQWAYDIKKDNWMITPGFNLGYGREYWVERNRGKDYLQLGPSVQFTSFDQAVAQANLFNYKEQLRGRGDQWHPISGWISLDGAYNAIRASRIHHATMEEIRERGIIINHPDAPK